MPGTVLLSALTPLLAWWPLQQGFGLSVPTTLLCLAVLSANGTGVTLQTPSAGLLVAATARPLAHRSTGGAA